MFQLAHLYMYHLVGEIMMDMWSIKEMIQHATLGIPKGIKKCDCYFYCFYPWLFDQQWKYYFRGMRNKTNKRLGLILHVEWVTSSQSCVANTIEEIMSRSNTHKWMLYFWLPFQPWRLVTRHTCNIISNGFCFCILRKLYFPFWSKGQSHRQ